MCLCVLVTCSGPCNCGTTTSLNCAQAFWTSCLLFRSSSYKATASRHWHAPVFQKLTSLRYLRLGWNEISALGEGLLDSLKNLENLDLANNAIQNLPTGFLTKLTKLRSLSLHKNDIAVLPHGFFERNTNLKLLSLRCDGCQSTAIDNPRMTCVPLTSAQISALHTYRGPTQSCACTAGYSGPDGGCIPCGAGTFITCSSAPWSVSFGACTFTGDSSGADLVRTGSCSTETGTLILDNKGITSLGNDPFGGMFGPDSYDYGYIHYNPSGGCTTPLPGSGEPRPALLAMLLAYKLLECVSGHVACSICLLSFA